MTRRASRRTAERWGTAGTAAVEFALVLPVLMALVLGTVEVGFRILSHASMTATLARVPDELRRAENPTDLKIRLANLAQMQLGLGLADIVFGPVAEDCVCPADAIRYLSDDVASLRGCSISCGTGVDPLRFYRVTWDIVVPTLVPRGDIGVHRSSAQVIVMRP